MTTQVNLQQFHEYRFTSHFNLGNASQIILAVVPVPPPTLTTELKPSKTDSKSFSATFVNKESRAIASWKAAKFAGF
ncbi:hypothetical protein K1719_012198 [Acacia pycnantha]|nr:hypothetical protein K1719_012198 [Acacia pycnantha]